MDKLFREFRKQWPCLGIEGLKNFLENEDKDTRKLIVNRKCQKEEYNILFYYCSLRDDAPFSNSEKIEIVKYLLNECGADIEMTGKEVIVEDHNYVHYAPPLWVTSFRGNLPLAEVLLEHGADVNGRSNSQSTAVRTMCHKNDDDMVKFLISKGADINIPNRNGSTCLMSAVKSVSLVKLLVENGANVNAREINKVQQTALHYAIYNENLDSFIYLLKSGADPSIPNKHGDSILRSAACFLQPAMVDVLCLRPDVTPNAIIEAFELLGAGLGAAENRDFVESEECWKHALYLRIKHNIPKEVKPFLPILGTKLEHTNLEELHTACDFDDEQVRESLLMKWRILGSLHEEFLFSLIQYGFYRSENYKTLQIFTYAHNLFLEKNKPLHESNAFSLRKMIKIAKNIFHQTSEEEKRLINEDIFCKFVDLIGQIQSVIQKGKYKTTSERSDVYNTLLFTSIIFAKFLLDVEKQSKRFLTACKKLADVNPKFVTDCQGGLLHAILDPSFFKIHAKGFINLGFHFLLDKDLIGLFVKNGFDVNSFDNDRRTCLHRFLRQSNETNSAKVKEKSEANQAIIQCLLDHRTHVDTVASDGENCLDLLRQTGLLSNEFKYRSLKCLAALVIGKHRIRYDGLIPFTLNPFVELHQQNNPQTLV